MNDTRLDLKDSGQATPDARLATLLRAWQCEAPRSGFEAAVWDRIRRVPVSRPDAFHPIAVLRNWLMPVSPWVHAVAAAAGVVIGIRLATPPLPQPAPRIIALDMPYAVSLTKGYLATLSGEQP